MAIPFPYTLYACPCSDTTSATPSSIHSRATSQQQLAEQEDDEETFNPHDPRANYALNPLDNLLFCDECNVIRCTKCWTEEIIYWYCPSCLFEVPSSGVKSDGNRCARNCYNCPICTASLSVTALNRQADNTFLKPGDSNANESYILFCQFCDWSSLDIGVRLSKPTKITEQLNKLRKARSPAPEDGEAGEVFEKEQSGAAGHDEAFSRLASFYKEQLSESSDHQNPFVTSPYGSPANLARIMSLYGGLSYNALKKSREKPQPMREAHTTAEGLSTFSADDMPGEDEILQKMRTMGLSSTTTDAQRLAAPCNFDARFVDQLWPVATPLRARRGRRCRTCRQFLARPEPKVGSMRYKIRLLALNHIQRLSIRPFTPHAPPLPTPSASFHLKAEPLPEPSLAPHHTQQYILTVRNPLFEPVKVTLATPATTPGRVASRVTILCPAFTVGPAGDVWDEALSASGAGGAPEDGSRRAAMASLTGTADGAGGGGGGGSGGGSGDRQPEAGKVWARSRNSTAVVLEVVPGALPSAAPTRRASRDDALLQQHASNPAAAAAATAISGNSAPGLLEVGVTPDLTDEDADVLEIPIYVRAEWEAEPHTDGATAAAAASSSSLAAATPLAATPGERKTEKESRELAYWCVLGLGRIAGG